MLYGLDIGGTKIELAVFNSQLEKQYSERVETPKSSYEESTTDTQSRIAYRVRGIGTAGAIVVAQVERYILVFLM